MRKHLQIFEQFGVAKSIFQVSANRFGAALQVLPAETRLTVYRRFAIYSLRSGKLLFLKIRPISRS